MEIIRPLTSFYKSINNKNEDIVNNFKLAIESTHEFRRQQKDVENYYTNFTHIVNKDINNDDFINHFSEIRFIRAYLNTLLNGLNNFENVLFKMQLKENRSGFIPTMTQLYTLVNRPYKKNISVDILRDEKEIDGSIIKCMPDANMMSCYYSLSLDNFNILRKYQLRYNSILVGMPNSYVENETHEKVLNRIRNSYFNLRPTSLTNQLIKEIYGRFSN